MTKTTINNPHNMKRPEVAENEALHDKITLKEQSLLVRLAVFLFRKQFNHMLKLIVSRAHERSIINSQQMHSICGIIDRTLHV